MSQTRATAPVIRKAMAQRASGNATVMAKKVQVPPPSSSSSLSSRQMDSRFRVQKRPAPQPLIKPGINYRAETEKRKKAMLARNERMIIKAGLMKLAKEQPADSIDSTMAQPVTNRGFVVDFAAVADYDEVRSPIGTYPRDCRRVAYHNDKAETAPDIIRAACKSSVLPKQPRAELRKKVKTLFQAGYGHCIRDIDLV